MVRYREMTTAEKRLFLIEAIETSPEVGLGLSIQIGQAAALEPPPAAP